MSLLGTSPGDIIQFHWITRWSACHDVSFRPALVNVVNGHGVTDKLGRGGWAHLHLGNFIGGIQRVIALSLGLELDDLGLGPFKVSSPQVGLILDESDVQSAWTRSVDVPV